MANDWFSHIFDGRKNGGHGPPYVRTHPCHLDRATRVQEFEPLQRIRRHQSLSTDLPLDSFFDSDDTFAINQFSMDNFMEDQT